MRLCAVTLFIEADAAVPESQVDCALAWAADAVQVAMPCPVPSLVCAPAFFRYQDLMAMPLPAVHAALVSAAHDGTPLAALRRMPLQARPAAARCSPNYLRFLVGVAVVDYDVDGTPDGLRWTALEEIVRSVLGLRLRVPVSVAALCNARLYGPAHRGLRTYQAARLGRIVAGLGSPGDLTALIDLPEAGARRRMRLTLGRERSCVAACMLQMPWDESPAQLHARISGWVRGRGITRVDLQAGLDEREAGAPRMLAGPI
jgi:hypothetical protein